MVDIFTENINNIKGLAYEKYVYNYLYTIYDIKEAYLWKNVPEYLLIETGIILENDKKIKKRYSYRFSNHNILLDTGIDIICKLTDNTILLVQCKAYSSIVSQRHLSGFYRTLLDCLLLSKNNKKKIIGLIVHTSSLSEIITTSYSYTSKYIQSIYIPYDEYKIKKYTYFNIYIADNIFNIKIQLNIIILLILLIIYYIFIRNYYHISLI